MRVVFGFFWIFKWILRDSIRQPRLAVKIAHATPMPTLPSQKAWLIMTSDNHSRFPKPSSPRRERRRKRRRARERMRKRDILPSVYSACSAWGRACPRRWPRRPTTSVPSVNNSGQNISSQLCLPICICFYDIFMVSNSPKILFSVSVDIRLSTSSSTLISYLV